jgi:hypothetical protein
MHGVIDIRDYRVRLPHKLLPYGGKAVLDVRPAGTLDPADPAWLPIRSLGKDFFRPAFAGRNRFNVPGPFYGAETDTCWTGPHEAPGNVLLDRDGQEFVCRQPADATELRDVLSAALCECFCGYGADGDDHWTLPLIRGITCGLTPFSSRKGGSPPAAKPCPTLDERRGGATIPWR